jgi:hypothetical protein
VAKRPVALPPVRPKERWDVRTRNYGAGRPLQCLNAWGGRGQNNVRRKRQKLLGISLKATSVDKVRPEPRAEPVDQGYGIESCGDRAAPLR